MFNLIKTDLYRLFHTKAFKVGIIASALIAFLGMLLNLGVLALIQAVMDSDPTYSVSGMEVIIPYVAWLGGADYSTIVLYSTGALSLLVGCVVSASFISAEQTCGYVKNVAGQLAHRGYTIVSKFIVTSLIHFVVLAIYTTISCVFAPVLFGKYIVSYSIAPLIGALLVRFLLFVAVNAIIVLLCTITKSPSLAMIIGAIFGLGVTQLGYMAISMVIGMVFKGSNFSFAEIMPDGINNMLTIFNVGELWARGVILSIIYIIAALACAIYIIEKRDVK